MDDDNRYRFDRAEWTRVQMAIGAMASAVIVIVFLLFVWIEYARAHEATTGWSYPASCCWSPQTAPAGRQGDCDEIPTSSVVAGADGYHVSLRPGDHPMVNQPHSFVVPYDIVKPAVDGLYHVCFAPDLSVRCFFAGGRFG